MKDIVWPVYRLSERKPRIENGVVFYTAEYFDKDTAENSANIRVVDDRGIDKPTLGLRRLRIPKGVSVFPIKTAIYFLVDLIKLAKSTTWFIDSAGKVFQYQKSTRAKLTFHKIRQILPAEGLGCIVEVEGLVFRFKSMKHPEAWEQYAGLIYISGGYMLYGFYEHKPKDTWRMV